MVSKRRTTPLRKRRFHMLFSADEWQSIERLARARVMNVSDTVRALIREATR